MFFVPIDHQNKIVKNTPLTWFLIGITVFISVQSFPYIFEDENKFEALIKNERSIASHQDSVIQESIQQEIQEKYLRESFIGRNGFVPERPSIISFISSLFIHGSFLHLFVNIFFLWFFGRFLEERYGSFWLMFLILAGGFFSVQFHSKFSTFQDVPLIGASGAISALLGAYVVSNMRNKVKIFYFIPPFDIGFFYIPTLALAAFWGITQLAGMIDSIHLPSSSSIGFHAHAGGFLAGTVLTKLFIDFPLTFHNLRFTSSAEKVFFKKGYRYLKAHAYGRALKFFDKALNIDPFHTRLKMIWMHSALHSGKIVPLPSFVASLADEIYNKYGPLQFIQFYKHRISRLPYQVPLRPELLHLSRHCEIYYAQALRRPWQSHPSSHFSLTASFKNAGFHKRFLAMSIDIFVLIVMNSLLIALLKLIMIPAEPEAFYLLSFYSIVFLFDLLYFQSCFYVSGKTLGKRVIGLQVVPSKPHEHQLTLLQSFLRAGGYILSCLPLGAGFFSCLWDKKRQCWHDKLSRSYVLDLNKFSS